jgi:hypothetical protein
MNWEYNVQIGRFDQMNDFLNHLNQLGADGWEAVGFAVRRNESAADDEYVVLLKRQKKNSAGKAPSHGQR